MAITVDLTQLSGYESLAAGTYTITAVAKGNGNTYTSSNKSQGSVYEKQASGYTINIIAGSKGVPVGSSNTYFKFNSNTVSTSDYDGYVSTVGVLTGPSTYTNVTSMAFVSTHDFSPANSVEIGSDSYHFSSSVQVIQINSSGNINIYGSHIEGPQ